MASHRYPRDLFGEVGVPDLGMDTDTVPRMMSSRKAQLVKNFLMDRPGVLPMRGPLCEAASFTAPTGAAGASATSFGLLGLWSHYDRVLWSQYAVSATATRDYWVAPYRRATAAAQLRAGAANSESTNLVTDLTNASGGTAASIGVRGSSYGNYAYGPEAASATTVTQDGYVYRKNALLAWDATANALAAYVNAPFAAQDVAVHYARLFVLGGIAVGGTRIEFNSLYWSDQLPNNAALTDVAGSWQDDVSGLGNRIVVGEETVADFGVALAHVGANLCILKRNSVWMLYGTSPANFVVKRINNELGCIDPRSVVEYDGGVYFMSQRGFMFYDGTRTVNVSAGLNGSLVTNALKQAGATGVDGGFVRAALLGRGYILIATGAVAGATGVATADTDAWLLHAPSGAWQQLSSGALASVIGAGRTTNYAWLMTDTKLVKANYIFTPNAAPAGTRGFDSLDGGTTKFIIPSRWTTRALELAAPTSKSKLQRIMAEYYWGLANGGWTVTATTRGATGVANPSAVLGAPTTVGATLPARGTVPVFNETDEVYFDVVATSSAPAAFNDAELHRLLVEYEPTGNTVPV